MRNLLYLLIFASLIFTFSCSVGLQNEKGRSLTKKSNSSAKEKKNVDESSNVKGDEKDSSKKPAVNASKKQKASAKIPTKKECENINTGDEVLLKSQTFPMDFKPFEGACFVTTHHPEYDDPPLGSVISIYKNDKKVYSFESVYNPDAATCWVEAVSFQDLNGDNLKDIIVVGKCGAKSNDIQSNEVFANNGETFETSVQSNDKLENFTKIKDIVNFVKNNQKLFFK